jgi:hypothetical protein
MVWIRGARVMIRVIVVLGFSVTTSILTATDGRCAILVVVDR